MNEVKAALVAKKWSVFGGQWSVKTRQASVSGATAFCLSFN
jgi:hypothetical protein